MEDIEEEPANSIILSKLFSKIFNPSPLIAGRYLQSIFSETKISNKFETEVRKSLYQSYNDNYMSKIVDEIIRLCIAPGNSPNLDSIITYNYDDIIEESLKKKNLDIPFESIYGQAIDPEDKKLKIYHVHGFLPRTGTINTENKITLGEFVYHEQYVNIYSWNNIVQINKFRDNTCLFIGTSLTDPNIRRLLDISNSQKKTKKFHYIIKKRTDKEWLKSIIKKLISEEPSLIEDKENFNLNNTIDFLIEMKNRFEEKDSESLGVKTVWIDDYEEEISNLLKKIRSDH
ncbi:SIR2 family protein [Riemerella anatipestifer]|nr:SIR2 family protein [Riemerella anatipestifer]MCO4304206.1 SIR2 family protein [Riemerella anatipestifer]MCQ4039411.1 SIR2 family protein [Riemerella anatipestifer]MCT6761096.1 SIR2 family protein [Riemerella anatipestifer]MCT6773576.1 SIR2 family protein [Riemerella anatipestifer]MCU7576542.1 SIR2 family protein [Riemerella anatipestifer]